MFPALFYGWWIVAASFLISVYVGCCGFFGFTAMVDPARRSPSPIAQVRYPMGARAAGISVPRARKADPCP